ncbi:MAG TPA: amidohydrolase family protein [Thermoanaerobaculia bacterium]|jgi:cytosine/adenosine deaminase-related metal-dependent hydrolase
MSTVEEEVVDVSPALMALNAFDSPRLALRGRIVSMTNDVIDDGILYIEDGVIAAVQDAQADAPDGFDGVEPIETDGTMYPGMLDLHNHLVYNVLAVWEVPKQYANRNQWQKARSYAEQVKAPMGAMAFHGPTIPAIVRYVETKALVSGTTAVQGMKSRFQATSPYFTGAVRNFESTGDKNLPAALTRIGDVKMDDPEDVQKFRNSLDRAAAKNAAMFYHLCEGVDDVTRGHYTALAGEKLVDKSMAAIHCLALNEEDFTEFDGFGSHIVWSPFSNTLLYGQTIDPKQLEKRTFTVGCDWSPSGSKNLLEELKVAWLTIEANKAKISAKTLVEGVTKNAAKAVGWDKKLGTLEKGKYADVVVIAGKDGDAYEHLIFATEREVRLVVIAGYARYGDADLMDAMPTASDDELIETLTVGGVEKKLDNVDPASKLNITYAEAKKRLEHATSNLPALAEEATLSSIEGDVEPLLLDNEDEGADDLASLFAAVTMPDSVALDGLTVVDDAEHFARLSRIGHLPVHLKKLRAMYK